MKNHMKTDYPYDDTNSKRHWKKYRTLYLLLCISVCLVGYMFLNRNPEGTCQKILIEILSALITGLVVYLLVDLSKSEKEREEYEKTLFEKICDALSMDNSKGLLNNYSSAKVKEVLRNCILFFNRDMADSYTTYISDNLKVLRRNFKYYVTLKEDDTIVQEIQYTRIFEPDPKSAKGYRMQCLFILDCGTLDQSLSKNDIFFREEITSKPFVAQIKRCVKDIKEGRDTVDTLIGLLQLEIEINDVCRKNNIEIDFEYGEDNLMLYITLSEKDICCIDNGYMSYRGKIKCGYPIENDNKFYCIFSDPTLGVTTFNFSAHPSKVPITNMISILSGCKEKPEYKKDSNSVVFQTDGDSNIFPRSGIVILWSNNKK